MFCPRLLQTFWIGAWFGSYAFVISVIMNNIIVTIFLRQFLATTNEDELRRREIERQHNQYVTGSIEFISSFDPVLSKMSNFHTADELNRMLSDLYKKVVSIHLSFFFLLKYDDW